MPPDFRALRKFFRFAAIGIPACALTGGPGSWCQLEDLDSSTANYIPLNEDLHANLRAFADYEVFSPDHLAKLYDDYLSKSQAHLAYACARVAVRCLSKRGCVHRERLSSVVDWVRKAIHALRHSFNAEMIEHTLRADLLWNEAQYIQNPEVARRLAMELSALLNERGHHKEARSLLEVADGFVPQLELEQRDPLQVLDFFRRQGQILLHQAPHKRSWKNYLRTAKEYGQTNVPFQVVEVNLNALGAFYTQTDVETVVERYEALMEGLAPAMRTPQDFHLANLPVHTNAAAKAELLLFSGVTLAAARGSSKLALAQLHLSDELFAVTCNHALPLFIWQAISRMPVVDAEVRSTILDLSTRHVQRKGLSRAALQRIEEVRLWLRQRVPGQLRAGVFIGTKFEGAMNFSNSTFYQSTFIENNMATVKDIHAQLAELQKLQGQLSLSQDERIKLEAEIAKGQRSIQEPTANKDVVNQAFQTLLQFLGSVSTSVVGNFATEAVKPQIQTIAEHLTSLVKSLI